MNLKKTEVCVIDTSVATSNAGDEIIMSSVMSQLSSIFHLGFFVKIPAKEHIFRVGIGAVRRSDYTIVGGTNFLSSFMNKFKAWKIWLWQALLMRKKVVLMGVGWRDYQGAPNIYTKFLLRQVLSRDLVHSVRDEYTKNKLQEIGFTNVINTSCPTMWALSKEHCRNISTKRSDRVVFTLTTYLPDTKKDRQMVDLLLNEYTHVAFWPQGRGDLDYFLSFAPDLQHKIDIIAPNLAAYDDYLEKNDCDYVGTRLHGGIRAIQNRKRTLIIGVDNRAEAKRSDFGLNVVSRGDLELLLKFVRGNSETKINVPVGNIKEWKRQFLK